MNVKELMVDDWYFDNKLQKVKRFSPLQFAESYENPTYELNLSPILITEDILKMNSFESENGLLSPNYTRIIGNKCVWWSRTLGISVTVYPNEHNLHSPYLCLPTCKYVHELQHALRVCDLNELANNIKVI